MMLTCIDIIIVNVTELKYRIRGSIIIKKIE